MANKSTVGPLVQDWITEQSPTLLGFKNSQLFRQFKDWCEMKQLKVPVYASFNTAMKLHKEDLTETGYTQPGSQSIVNVEEPNVSLEKKEKNIEVNVDLLANEFSNGFILSGPTGIGKTSAVLARLQECELEYHYFNGAIGNPLEFYKYLYHHRDGEILVIDDTAGLIGSNAVCGDIVSAALDDNHLKQNVVSYLHKDLKYPEEIAAMGEGKRKENAVPNKFTVTTGMIFLTNTPMAQISKAIGSRCFPLDYWLTKDEILLKIENNLQNIFPDGNIKQKREVLEYFHKHKHEMKRFDIRSFKKACLYRFAQHQLKGSANWKTMTKVLVNSGT